eukprot:TRINITY_DN10294_c0_g1_i9.p1 TRINITY_DN10294_c0_g1~~TRINITY_DN10294_c0_g1_i9.p1  ORF type:complete len:366 (-),score=39.67 TRINITY_DN10294_c0_g1_i9:297-1394(-)
MDRIDEEEQFVSNFAQNASQTKLQLSKLQRITKPPIWTYFLLTASVLSVSSAAAIFKYLQEVPSQMLASWRLQLTSVVLLPGFIYQLRQLDENEVGFAVSNIGYLCASGTALAVHFGSWVAGIHLTSLPHALLIVTACPSMIMAAGAWVLRKPISWGELLGTLMGVLGCALLVQGANTDHEVSYLGDFYCFIGALSFVAYALIGKHLRSQMPIFIYAFPVTLISAILLSFWALLIGGSLAGTHGTTAYLYNGRYFLCILGLALGPGFIGHTGFNLLLKYFPTLVITVCYSMEPICGSIIGWLAGLTGIPVVWTWLGGTVILSSAVTVNLSANQRQKQESLQEIIQLDDEVKCNLDMEMQKLINQD